MITYSEACEAVGYNRSLTSPSLDYIFYAYKSGNVREFDNEKDARNYSDLVEKHSLNKEEIAAFKEIQRDKEQQANEYFLFKMREEYSDLSEELFNIIYGHAYDEGHGCGYDEILNSFRAYYRFYKDIKKELLKEQSNKTQIKDLPEWTHWPERFEW